MQRAFGKHLGEMLSYGDDEKKMQLPNTHSVHFLSLDLAHFESVGKVRSSTNTLFKKHTILLCSLRSDTSSRSNKSGDNQLLVMTS